MLLVSIQLPAAQPLIYLSQKAYVNAVKVKPNLSRTGNLRAQTFTYETAKFSCVNTIKLTERLRKGNVDVNGFSVNPHLVVTLNVYLNQQINFILRYVICVFFLTRKTCFIDC